MKIKLIEKKPHGILFGGFTSLSINNEEFGRRIHDEHPNEMVVAGLFNGLESYRSYGNHRIATHIRKTGWDVEVIDYSIFFTNEELLSRTFKLVRDDG